jgi:hypothetical protein
MRTNIRGLKAVSLSIILSSVLNLCIPDSVTVAASSDIALLKAKKDAEAKGYIFETSHDEIIAKARKEARLRVLSTMDLSVIKALRDAFPKAK